MSIPDFAHLHVHTEYSFDAFSRIDPLVAQTKAHGMNALAITDHGVMHGVWNFYHACKQAEIHPVIGLEAYLADDLTNHHEKSDNHHLLLLAENNVGYHNLLQLTTLAHIQGYYYRPRIDKRVLAEHAEGLIMTSGCLSAEVPRLLLKGDESGAKKALQWYQDVFGPNNVYLEVQDRQGIQDLQGKVNQQLYALHQNLHLPLVATNDLHYIKPEDAYLRDVLLCIRQKKRLTDPTRLKASGNDYYLRSPAEMWQSFADLPDALMNSVTIAQRCQVTLETEGTQLPEFPIPKRFTSPDKYLRHLCLQGTQARFGEVSEAVQRRLDYELDIIVQKGFASYFLIIWEAVAWARDQGIRCSARGSAAGSLVAYTLRLTNIDPLLHGLLFERFLNPLRPQLPDIDIDVPATQRAQVDSHLIDRYGTESVAHIITFTTLAAKNSLKDVSRVLGKPEIGERLAHLIPAGTSSFSLAEAIATFPELQKQQKGEAKAIIDLALAVEGSVRGTSQHAAGIVIASGPLHAVVPLQRGVASSPASGLVSQYGQSALEALGLLKMDFLASSNLTILQNTLNAIKETRGIALTLEQIPLDDPKTFELFAHGHTTGVFQFENPQLAGFLKQLHPTSIQDLVATIALYRPGPIAHIHTFIEAKHGRKQVTYLDPRLKEWLEESYGIIVYQDQVLLTVVNIAGFDWKEADAFRKAMGKKIPSEIARYQDKFITGCTNNGMHHYAAKQLYEQILPFASYGFNKAHAASYATIAYYTGYLKVHYTPEFMAATLTAEVSETEKIIKNIAECKRLGVYVLPPDIQHSDSAFTVEDGAVRFGLMGIKGIGNEPAYTIVQARTESGPFQDLSDFCARVNTKTINKSAIELLIKAGAMDSLGNGQRYRLLNNIEHARRWAKQKHAWKSNGMQSLFGESDQFITTTNFSLDETGQGIDQRQFLAWEKELLGTYVSNHPHADTIGEAQRRLAQKDKGHYATTATITEERVNQHVVLTGLITEVRSIKTTKGEAMCLATLEDQNGSVGLTVFPRLYNETTSLWNVDTIVVITGKVQAYKGKISVVCDRASAIENQAMESLWTVELQ